MSAMSYYLGLAVFAGIYAALAVWVHWPVLKKDFDSQEDKSNKANKKAGNPV